MAGIEVHDEILEWLDSLTESQRVSVIIDRLADGLFELRFTLGPTAR